jgi:hypothetical protein
VASASAAPLFAGGTAAPPFDSCSFSLSSRDRTSASACSAARFSWGVPLSMCASMERKSLKLTAKLECSSPYFVVHRM